MNHRLSVIFLFSSALMFAASSPASAKGYKAETKQCASSKGTLAIKDVNAGAWAAMGVADPKRYIASMIVESGCFTVTNSVHSATYTLTAGPLTKAEHKAGEGAFSGQSISTTGSNGRPGAGALEGTNKAMKRANEAMRGDVDALASLLGGSKMNYAFVDIRNSSGNIVARGFGRGTASNLDYSHWKSDQVGLNTFNADKKSRRAGGTLFNAYEEVIKAVDASDFGQVRAQQNMSADITVSQLLDERYKNGSRFQTLYGDAAGGKYIVVSGFVNNADATNANLKLQASANSRSYNHTTQLECVLTSFSAGARLNRLNKGDPVTVSGVMTSGAPYTGFGISDPMIIRKCTVVSP